MSVENQRIIQKCRRAWTMAMRRLGIARAREKVAVEQLSAWLELLYDDIRFEGIDPHGPLGQQIVARALRERIARAVPDDPNPWCDDEGFPKGGGL